MLDSVIRFSLRHRPLVLVMSLMTLGYGAYVVNLIPIDVFPDLDRPRVVILAECPTLASEEIETLVTQPIEAAMLGASGVEVVRSNSAMGLAVVYVEFDWSTEVRAARQVVQERLANVVPLMPPDIHPLMTPPTSILGQIMHVGLHRQLGPGGGTLAPLGDSRLVAERIDRDGQSSLVVWQVGDRHDPATWKRAAVERAEWQPDVDMPAGRRCAVVSVAGKQYDVEFADSRTQQMELRTLADWVVRPRLLKLSGIAEVLVLGGQRKQYQVLVDPAKLLAFDVSLQQVERALQANNLSASGGFTVEGQTERPIRVLGRLGPDTLKVLDELRKIPVAIQAQRSVLLADVAEAVVGPPSARGDASIDGNPGVVITVVKQPHVDTRGLTAAVHAVLADVEAALPQGIVINQDLFELENFIDRGIYYVAEALVLGGLLVVIVLALFLLNVRTTFITLTAIPLSLAVTAIVFRWLGLLAGRDMSINVMTLGGMAVAMGELVDDAIVDVENIFRRLRENRALADRGRRCVVVYDASREIRGAIVFGTLVVILVFLPLFAMSGVEGRLFAPLGIAYIVSILASLAVSLTVTPVLSNYLLPNSRAGIARLTGLCCAG